MLGPDRVAALATDAERLQRTELTDTNNIRCRWQDDAVTGECRFDCFDPVIDLSDADRSASNASTRWRRLLYLSFNRLSDGGEQRDAHYEEFRGWLQTQYAAYGRAATYFR